MKNKILYFVLLAAFIHGYNPSSEQSPHTLPISKIQVPDWVKNANIYEVNIRRYTEEGTFDAFQAHMPRLHDMGVEILWFMPIHPISISHRKGSLGSYYAVSDYRGINT